MRDRNSQLDPGIFKILGIKLSRSMIEIVNSTLKQNTRNQKGKVGKRDI